MYCKTNSGAIDGLDGVMVIVEADISEGLPQFDMVGLLSSEVKEAKERVRIAIKNSGFRIPPKRITINLSPADVRKDGTGFDLPIALTVLSAIGIIPVDYLKEVFIIGELGLDGQVKKVNGILPLVYEAKKHGYRNILVPMANSKEAAVIDNINVYGIRSLKDAIEFLNNDKYMEPEYVDVDYLINNERNCQMDFSDVYGQETVKRAIEIAVSGMHNMLMIGPPGAGKTMMAKRIPGIMPRMSFEESMEISKIYSIAGLINENIGLMVDRPFRYPHHSITTTAMVGGGRKPKPGEVSLASKGVLFLDELPEFKKDSLEVLRQPLEDGYINISRLNGSYRFTADFMMVCAMNPCRCGYYPDRNKCKCNEADIHRYLGKISRPLLDRIDICVEAQQIQLKDMEERSECETSEKIRERVERTRDIQRDRFSNKSINFNSQMKERDIKKYCKLDSDAQRMVNDAFESYGLTVRGYNKIIKVARTIADMNQCDRINKSHISEAIIYRSNDQRYWGGV